MTTVLVAAASDSSRYQMTELRRGGPSPDLHSSSVEPNTRGDVAPGATCGRGDDPEDLQARSEATTIPVAAESNGPSSEGGVSEPVVAAAGARPDSSLRRAQESVLRSERRREETLDITERKRPAGDERDSLAAAVEQSADGIVITDTDWRITYANAAFASSVGRVPSDLVGMRAPDVAAIGLDETTLADMVRTVSAGHRWFREVDHRNPDGTLRRIEANISPIREANGEVWSWVGVMRDLTPIREAEAERTRLASAVENAADLVVISNPNGIIEYVNPAFERMTGNSADDVLGLPKASVLRSYVHSPEFYAGLDGAVRRGEPWAGMITVRRRDGSLFEYEALFSPIRDPNGNLVGTVEIGRDRTHEREMEADLALEAEVRGLLETALRGVPSGASLELAAQALCDGLGRMPGIAFAAAFAFGKDDLITAVGHHAPPGFPESHGLGSPPGRQAGTGACRSVRGWKPGNRIRRTASGVERSRTWAPGRSRSGRSSTASMPTAP